MFKAPFKQQLVSSKFKVNGKLPTISFSRYYLDSPQCSYENLFGGHISNNLFWMGFNGIDGGLKEAYLAIMPQDFDISGK